MTDALHNSPDADLPSAAETSTPVDHTEVPEAAMLEEFEEADLSGIPAAGPVDEAPAAGSATPDDFEDFNLPEPPIAAVGAGTTFDQAGIDALFGFDDGAVAQKRGLKAVIESNIISHERLPMLEVVCDRVVRTFATSMRNLTSDAIDVTLEEVTSTRFGDFMNRVALPSMIAVFKVREWDNYGLVTVESSLIYAVVDALLGGRKGNDAVRIEGRGFTTIETSLVSRMLELILTDLAGAFESVAPITMDLERIETRPRFTAIAGPTNVAAVATFRIDMEGRGGRFSVLIPHATLEPVREKLIQRFMGEKLGGDRMWETHMAEQVRQTEVSLDVLLGHKQMCLREVMSLEIGQTIQFCHGPDDALAVECGRVPIGMAYLGQRNGSVCVRLGNEISRGFAK